MDQVEKTVEFPDKLQGLFSPSRYKIIHGGRGGAKSWGIARALLLMGCDKQLRIGCFREIQKSINESVHHLLDGQIKELGLSGFYQVQNNKILGANGTEFVFSGLRTQSVENLKSFEGIDIAWVEEARNVSKRSWDVLVPTIRKPGSEIWISFNPELDTDETYVRFVSQPPRDAQVIQINWRDNPWFPDVLRLEMDAMRERDPDGYLTVWEGQCRQALEGAIYAAEIRAATESGRITNVPYEPTRPVHTFWDLGWSDSTAIWLVQAVGFEVRVIGYIEDNAKPLDYYISELNKYNYVWGVDWLPHDARAKSVQTGRSIEEMLRGFGRDVRVVPNLGVADGINAVRALFPRCYFDKTATSDGLNRLRRYCYKIDESGQRSRLPLHDENSHGADAFRYLAIGFDQHGADRAAAFQQKPKIKFMPRCGVV